MISTLSVLGKYPAKITGETTVFARLDSHCTVGLWLLRHNDLPCMLYGLPRNQCGGLSSQDPQQSRTRLACDVTPLSTLSLSSSNHSHNTDDCEITVGEMASTAMQS